MLVGRVPILYLGHVPRISGKQRDQRWGLCRAALSAKIGDTCSQEAAGTKALLGGKLRLTQGALQK